MKNVTMKRSKTDRSSLGSRMFLGITFALLLATVTGCDPEVLQGAREVMTAVQDAASREVETTRILEEERRRSEEEQRRKEAHAADMARKQTLQELMEDKLKGKGGKTKVDPQKGEVTVQGKDTTRIIGQPKGQMPKKTERAGCDLRPLRAGRKFVAEAWALPDSKFNFGEPLAFQMRVSSPTYMSVFHVSTSCKVMRLLDNMPVKAAEIVDFPLRDSGMKIVVRPPAGMEAFYLIATRKKLEFLASADILSTGGSGIARLDLSPKQFYQRVKQFRDRINPDDLSMRTLLISKMTSAPKKTKRAGCNLRPLRASRKFIAEAWAVPDNKFNFGEPLTIQMRVSSPTYMSVFHVSTSCQVTRLLDNKPVKAAEIVDFPSRDSGMKVIVKPPAGREAFYLIATREKLEFLANADILNSGGGGIARLYLTPEQFYQRVKQFRDRINPDDLSIRSLRISIIGN